MKPALHLPATRAADARTWWWRPSQEWARGTQA